MTDKKILILIGILVVSLIMVYIIQNEKAEVPSYQRQNITFLKFVSSENCMYSLDSQEINELKSLNINGIRICPLYSISQDGNIREDIPEFVVINLVRKAQDAGFVVFLDLNAGGRPTETGEPEYRYDKPEYVNDLYGIALHWAKIAERERVEFYSPLNEPDLMFAEPNLANQWIEKSQGLRPFFSGNLVLKLADTGPEKIENMSGYDYLAFDIMWGDAQYQELREHMRMATEKGNELKERYGLKGFFFGELGAERGRADENTQAEIFKIFFEETWGKVDGYCFLGWSDLEFRFRDNDEAKNVIREWYGKRN